MKNLFNSVINFLNKVFVNHQDYGEGRKIEVIGNRVLLNGIDITPDSKIITIEVRGDIDTIIAGSANVTVYGNVKGSLQTGSGDVNISVSATDVKTGSGDVLVGGTVSGNVNTSSGDVATKSIGGSVSTKSGDVSKSFR